MCCVIEVHMGLVYLAARRAVRSGIPYDDAVQDGTLGLLRAEERFDKSTGYQFSTYAYPGIAGAIIDGARQRSEHSRSWNKQKTLISRAREYLSQRLYRQPTLRELAEEVGLSVDELALWEERLVAPTALDAPIHSNGEDSNAVLSDVVIGTDGRDASDQAERMLVVKARMKKLTAREQQIVGLYFYDDRKLREIAQILDLTEGRISQLLTGALEKLRTSVRSILRPAKIATQAVTCKPEQPYWPPKEIEDQRRQFLSLLWVEDHRALEYISEVTDYAFYRDRRVQGLADHLQVTRRTAYRRFARYGLAGPNHWLMMAKILLLLWHYGHYRGSFHDCVADLGLGDEFSLSNLCMRITGLRPRAIRRECREAGSIGPFVSRSSQYLREAS